MDSQETQDFNQRLNQWIASQGLWFQLRHTMSSGGGVTAAAFHLLRLLARLGLVVLVAAVGFGIYLIKRVESDSFREGMRSGVERALNASEARISGFRRTQGQAMIRRVGASGTQDAFFQSVEAGNLQFSMGLLDGVAGTWDAGVIRMDWLDLELRAGAAAEEASQAAAESFFANHPDFLVRGLDVNDARLSWGYFERAYGGISGSRMTATRTGDGWRLRFRGGHFSQNWIRRFEIDELVVFCSADGLLVEDGLLRVGEGSVRFEDVRVAGSGVLPEPSGTLVFDRVPLKAVLPANVTGMVEGNFSGRFELGGSTNSVDGVTLTGRANLDGNERITIRSELPLFEALDVVDVFNSYRRVDFDRGSFDLSTRAGELVISGLDLGARDLMEMLGRITIRRPEDAELERLFGMDPTAGAAIGGLGAGRESEVDVNLRAAGRAAREGEDPDIAVEPGEATFFSDIAEKRLLRRDAMERARGLFVFDGGVTIMIPGDAFERSRELRERFPVDQSTGKIRIDVPLRGTLGNLTLDLAEEILNRDSDN